jgi:hypothetical protein
VLLIVRPAGTFTRRYNNRLQLTSSRATSSNGTAMDLTYSYDQGGGINNGNLVKFKGATFVIFMVTLLLVLYGAAFRLLVNLPFLARGYGVVVPMPHRLLERIPPRVQILIVLYGGPVLLLCAVVATWYFVRQLRREKAN